MVIKSEFQKFDFSQISENKYHTQAVNTTSCCHPQVFVTFVMEVKEKKGYI